jgi:peptide maturation system protein (TIGR04066 family)
VIFFNHHVKQLEKEEKPDVIIIGIPGGILPFDRKFHNRFGILPFLISQAVEPDAAVFSSVYEDWKEKYFTELALTIQYRFGFQVDCFNLSNAQVDWAGCKQVNTLQINRLNSHIVDEKIKKLGNLDIPVFNSLNKEDSLGMFQFLRNRLVEYAQVGSF